MVKLQQIINNNLGNIFFFISRLCPRYGRKLLYQKMPYLRFFIKKNQNYKQDSNKHCFTYPKSNEFSSQLVFIYLIKKKKHQLKTIIYQLNNELKSSH